MLAVFPIHVVEAVLKEKVTMNEAEKVIERGKIYRLPRGGYITDTCIGYVQVGSPPETIKDSMYLEKGVPGIICLPQRFFSRDKGISVAEVEFPIYYNFFLKQLKTKLICDQSQIKIFRQVIKEALFGPEAFDIAEDFPEGWKDLPKIDKEMASFVNFKLEDVVELIPIDKNLPVVFDKLTIQIRKDGNFELIDDEYKLRTIIPSTIDYKVIYDVGNLLSKPFQAPQLGVTCLGPSHGFDPKDNTSGFIIWLGGSGIMVDPPVNSTEWLTRSNVNPKIIDSIILTHTHADHDAGTLQKILEEERITIYTTRTILSSWLYKYSTLTQIPQQELASLFDFIPITIGEKVNIKGAWFRFRYMLHSIPTMGFDFKFRGRSFVYSSDHLNSKEKFDQLLKDKIISKARHEEFLNFPWDSDIIYHESGFPPLHTPISELDKLPREVKKKITVYHIAAKDFPEKTDLTLAKFGISNTVVLDVKESPFYQAYNTIDLISHIDLFKDFNVTKVRDLLSICEVVNFPKGSHVITKGNYEDKFYIIVSGSFVLYKDEKKNEVAKRFGRCQYLGEVSLFTNSPRTADIYAETEVEAISISRKAFLKLIKDTSAEKKLKSVIKNRDMLSWRTLSATAFFDKLTSSQKTELELLMKRHEIKKDREILKPKSILDELFFFCSGDGTLKSTTDKGKEKKLKRGDVLGHYDEFFEKKPSTLSCKLKKGSIVFSISRDTFDDFLKLNPGIYVRFFKSQRGVFS